jgi:multidrug efflux pump subunit AcrB
VDAQAAPLTINHYGQFPAVTFSFNSTPGHSLSEAVEEIQSKELALNMPTGVNGEFQGAALAFKKSLANQPMLILSAVLAIYIVLGILYESYVHPLTILSTIPSSSIGALAALMALKLELSLISFIGIILLIGIVKKNGIMLVDFAIRAEAEQHCGPREAIYQACMTRFRPIMMTTLAAVLGAIPLLIGHGEGSELRYPLGVTLVAGLVASQLLTLLSTPVIYLYLARLRSVLARRSSSHANGAYAGAARGNE